MSGHKVTKEGDWRIHDPEDCPVCEAKQEARTKISETYGPEFLERFEKVAADLKGATTEGERRLAVSAAVALYFEAEAKADGMDSVMFLLPSLMGRN